MTVSKKGQACATVLLMMLVACGGNNEQTSVAEARLALDKGDFNTASIHVKNALQIAPESAQARFLFGKLLLESGDVRAAEIELRKAQELKYPIGEVAPLLARSLLAREKYSQIITDYANLNVTDAGRQADLSAMVASAYAFSGRPDKALALVDSTVEHSPDNVPIRLVQARLIAAKGDIDGALKVLDEVTGRGGKNIDAWRLQGDLLLYGKRDRPRAQAAYRKVLAVDKDDIYAHTQLIGSYLIDKDLKAAKQQFDLLAKLHPAHPQTRLLEANIALRSGDFSRARDILAQVMSRTKDNPKVLLMAAATELQLNSLVQAENYLNKVLSLNPASSDARRLLAAVLLRRGEAARTLEVLRPLLDGVALDAETLTLAAEAHLLAGDAQKAEAFFTRVTQLKPDDVQARTALALTQMAKGQTVSALADLQSIAASDKGTLADMALISVRLRQGDLDGALKAIDTLDKKLPERALPADLRGRVYLLKHDSAKARLNFEKALGRDPVHFPSVAALAQIDIVEGRADSAQQRFDALLKADPKNIGALVALAGLRTKQGASADEVTQLLTRAIDANPSDSATRLLLVEHWFYRGRSKQAQEAAQAGLAAIPDEPSLLEALGRAQLANNQVAQALSTFGKLAAQHPKSAFAQLRLADAQLRVKNSDAAERALRQALQIAPELLAAQRGLMMLAVQANQPEKGLEIARAVQRQRPKDAIGYVLEGDLHAKFKDWGMADKAYRAGLQKQGAGAAAVRLYVALQTARGKPEADRFAEDWSKQYPKETRLRLHLAQQAVEAGNLALAEQIYSIVVKLEPRNAAATNDLAWVMAKNKKAGAVAMAERALALAPSNPIALDTLAIALAGENQFQRAIEASKSAVRLAPEAAPFRLNLAKIYLQAQDKKSAKAELDELTKVGATFSGHREVAELIKGL